MLLTRYQAYELVNMESRVLLNTQAPGMEVYLAADVDAMLATHTDGYTGARTTWTLIPKQGEPIELRLPAPVVQYILELDAGMAEKDNTLQQRDAFVKEQRARIELLESKLAEVCRPRGLTLPTRKGRHVE